MVAVGSSDDEPFFEKTEAGLKADDNICATLSAGQVAVMLSGNFLSTLTRTADEELRPIIVPEIESAFLRISPIPSASPVYGSN